VKYAQETYGVNIKVRIFTDGKGENPIFNFPLKTLPQCEPVYVIGFSKDSLLAKVVSYYDYGAMRGGNFTKGWVYAKCLHKEPPRKKM